MTDPMQRAVEAVATELYHDSEWGYCREEEQCKHCHGRREGFRRVAARYLKDALPHLEAHFREKVAGEVEAEDNWIYRTRAEAADFIRKGVK